MHESTCDLCENAAVIHETVARRGVVKVRRFCRGHGLKLWRDSVVPALEHVAGLRPDPSPQAPVTVPSSGFRVPRRERDAEG